MKSAFIFTLLLLSLSCSKSSVDKTSDAFEFGTFYSMCIGNECHTTYSIRGNKLYRTTVNVSSKNKVTVKLSDSKYQTALVLKTGFPDAMLAKPNTTYGCPDCADGGGTFVRIIKNSDTLYWNYDNTIQNDRDPAFAYFRSIWPVMAELKK
ncbi:hypothetical protein [Niabella beijingensis]|uniref:hypothetical protein n=1 Tax=Niabella beijingensis TaxID=2872700 RepID=UPI001CC19254|nr:hypothetical protein [Niabella beijingensis]MBZ4190220.1 hypothetical protein [Niabella beijingensis]